MNSITFKVTWLVFLCSAFFSLGVSSTSVVLPDRLQPSGISYSYFIKHWESELLVEFSAAQISAAPIISINGELLRLQEVFKDLNIERLYANNIYVSVEPSRDFKDYNSVHIFIEADEASGTSRSRPEKGSHSLKYLFVKIYKNRRFEAKLIEDK